MKTLTFKRDTIYSYRSTCKHYVYLCGTELVRLFRVKYGRNLPEEFGIRIRKSPTADSCSIRLTSAQRVGAHPDDEKYPFISIDGSDQLVECDTSFELAWKKLGLGKTVHVEVLLNA
ncbi:MAG: hypothetical protein ACYS7Y_04260 [Planctomycetota bacterium]|jgi:hypothetical protein